MGCHFLLQCVKVKSLNCVQLFVTPWTAAQQAPPSMGFSKQEYWSGVPLPSPKISLSQLLMMSDLNFKEKSLFLAFLKERDTFITLHPHFYTATICCCWQLLLLFIWSHLPHFFIVLTTPFHIPNNHYPWTFLHKETVFMFQSKMEQCKKGQEGCLFQKQVEKNICYGGEREYL